MIDDFGWIGNLLLSCCAIQPAWEAFKNKKTLLSTWFMIPWFLGELFALIYVVGKGNKDFLPILLNYGVNIFCLLILLKYKLSGGKYDKQEKRRKTN